MLNVPVAVGILLLWPLILLRLAVDENFRRQMTVRTIHAWAYIKARPAVGLLFLCVALVLGAVMILLPRLFWTSHPPVEVIIWTSAEKQGVLEPALEAFNQMNMTMTLDGGRYRVHAYSVPVSSEDIQDHLLENLNHAAGFPDDLGAPTVVSPSTSAWLALINLEARRQVFQMKRLRPIARTPLVVLTYREMAECLGWPVQLIGWTDILALSENPEGWAACPTARAEWGQLPLLVMPDPASTYAGRSTLEVFHSIASGKPTEQLGVSDVRDSDVRDYVSRFTAAVNNFYSSPGQLQAMLLEGPRSVHFASVDEFQIPYFYQEQSTAGSEHEVVAIYPADGTVWHDHPFAVPDAPWVTAEQRAAALLVEEYLRSAGVQDRFMEAGFRAGIYVEQRDILTPPLGLDLKQPQVFFGHADAETAQAIQQSWEKEEHLGSEGESGIPLVMVSRPGALSPRGGQHP